MVDGRILIEKILAGDLATYEIFVRQYQKLVSHIVFRMVGNETDREDICQEVFIKAYRNLSKFQFESKVSTWIGKIAHNTAINYLAKKRPTALADVGEEDTDADSFQSLAVGPEGLAESGDVAARLRAGIQSLSLPYRTVVTLYHLDEMSYNEIAAVMDLPINTVKSHLFRARQKLKEKLLEQYDPEDLCQ